MLAGKLNAALRLILETKVTGILQNSKQNIDILKEKHPESVITFRIWGK